MKIRLNGKESELCDNISVMQMIELLAIPKEGTAVAVNMQIVPRSAHQSHIVHDGDDVEIIHAIGGG